MGPKSKFSEFFKLVLLLSMNVHTSVPFSSEVDLPCVKRTGLVQKTERSSASAQISKS